MHKNLRILFAASRLPSHLTTGDRLRAYYLIAGLANRGHQIDLLAFENLAEPRIETDIFSICNIVRPVHFGNVDFGMRSRREHIRNLLEGARNGFPRHVWQFHSPVVLKAFAEMVSRTHYDVFHFSEIGVAELLYTSAAEITSARVFDLIDAVSMAVRSSLRYRHDLSWPTRLIESFQLLRFEKSLLDKVDAGIVVSPKDREFLGSPPQLYVIPNGINIPQQVPELHKDIDLIFVGNMSAEANVDAVTWFTQTVWPHIRAARPTSTFSIVGRDPRPSVLQLADDHITVTGAVEDVHAYLSRAKVFVAPMRFGAGQKNKILEAFVNRLPVVATSEANAGIGAQDGQNIVIRDDPDAMASSLLMLLDDPVKRTSIGMGGYELARASYSWDASVELLEQVYEQAIQASRGQPHSIPTRRDITLGG